MKSRKTVSVARGEETEVADLVDAARRDVLEKAMGELDGRKSHRLPALLAGVLVAEGDAAIVQGEDSAVGDGDAVDIAS